MLLGKSSPCVKAVQLSVWIMEQAFKFWCLILLPACSVLLSKSVLPRILKGTWAPKT